MVIKESNDSFSSKHWASKRWDMRATVQIVAIPEIKSDRVSNNYRRLGVASI